jgi:alpha-tubulin suppressor-like RCC1 family protein
MAHRRPRAHGWHGAVVALAVGAASVACDAVFGLDGFAPADGGVTRDAAVERKDAARPGGAAIVVASSIDVSDWCAVTLGGDVECWGNNESGQLGNGTTVASATPVKVQGLPLAASVAVGFSYACAITRAGAVFCWGNDQDGELGNGSMLPFSKTPVPARGLADGVTSIACAGNVVCAIQNGAVLCWGFGPGGLLGTNGTNDALVPTRVPGLESGVTSVSLGDNSACAVKDGAVLCWGGIDGEGELGNGTLSSSATPVPVPSLKSGVADVSVGSDFACALESSGGVLCWGDGTSGALGNGQLAVNPVPVQVHGLTSGVSTISAGATSVSAVLSDGTVLAWGNAADGELGNGSAEYDAGVTSLSGGSSTVPVKVKGLSGPPISISTGQAPCVATTAGGVECWGLVAENALAPVPVSALDGVGAVTTGGSQSSRLFACAISMGDVWCWGANDVGQFGNGGTTGSTVPVMGAAIMNVTALSGSNGGDFACAVSSGIAYCWGDNGSGQLGNGTKISSLTPVPVSGLTNDVVSIAAGTASTCALTTGAGDGGADGGAGGAVYCWGDNTYGSLGNGTTSSSLVPVPVMGLGRGVTALSVGAVSACVLLVDSTVECWGANETGQLGDGTTNTSLAPTKVVGLTGVTAISAGWYASCAVAGGTVQCWGDDEYGELGNDMLFTESLVPGPVTCITGVASEVSISTGSACAVISSGVSCWGSGPLGNYATPYPFLYPSPVVGLTTGVTAITSGYGSACAVAHGRAECWGYNTAGELGNGGAVDAFVPVPVPGFP